MDMIASAYGDSSSDAESEGKENEEEEKVSTGGGVINDNIQAIQSDPVPTGVHSVHESRNTERYGGESRVEEGLKLEIEFRNGDGETKFQLLSPDELLSPGRVTANEFHLRDDDTTSSSGGGPRFGSLSSLSNFPPPKKIRTFEHVEGNFPVHVFIPVPISAEAASRFDSSLFRTFSSLSSSSSLSHSLSSSPTLSPFLSDQISSVNRESPSMRVWLAQAKRKREKERERESELSQSSLFPSPSLSLSLPSSSLSIVPPTPSLPPSYASCLILPSSLVEPSLCCFHLSLSRTVAIRFHQIQSLLGALRQRLRRVKEKFRIPLSSFCALSNDSSSRSFLSLESVDQSAKRKMTEVVNCVNEAFKMHNLPPFYESPRPHISLLWAPGELLPFFENLSRNLNVESVGQKTEDKSRISPLYCGVEVDQIICKVGQKVNHVWTAK